MRETLSRQPHLSVVEADGQPPAVALQDVLLERGGKALVDGLTLTLSARGTTVLMGPNGAGKSLTLRLLAGLIPRIRAGFAGTATRRRPHSLRRWCSKSRSCCGAPCGPI